MGRKGHLFVTVNHLILIVFLANHFNGSIHLKELGTHQFNAYPNDTSFYCTKPCRAFVGKPS